MTATQESRAFGELIRLIRADLTQEAFARRLGVSRSTLANAEVGRLPGPTLSLRLANWSPGRAQEIHDSYLQAATGSANYPASSGNKSDTLLLRRIRALIHQGRFVEARGASHRAIEVDRGFQELVEVWTLLAESHFLLGAVDDGIAALRNAIGIAEGAGFQNRAVELQDELAGRLTRLDQFDLALAVVEAGLRVLPDNALLWRRQGVVLWYAHRYVGAYSALTTALDLGLPRLRVLHARGQVLSEWGQFSLAIEELTEAIEGAASLTSAAYAQSGRAHAYAGVGKTSLALEEFALAELSTPDNAWLHYFRSRCYDEMGDVEAAIEGYRRALVLQGPSLNKPKRNDALQRLEFYEQSQCG